MTAFTRTLLAVASVTLLAGGCAHNSRAMDDAGSVDERTVLRVTNNNWADMTIYLLRSGMRQRLGTVSSQSSQTFIVPSHAISSSSEVYLVADPIGTMRTYTSEPIVFYPGQTAEWQLENLLALSTMWIR